FFFQAEDGIRDRTVTGVQTCALPICLPSAPCAGRRAAPSRGNRSLPASPSGASVRASSRAPPTARDGGRACSKARSSAGTRRTRSEERRVGKEQEDGA